MNGLLIYGASGYTGELIAERAVADGARPMLAGRDERKVRAVAERLGCPFRIFGLDDPDQLANGLDGVTAVLHCAGPFSRTAAPMVDACLRTRSHYLDITGELEVLEALAGRDSHAQRAGVMLMPGVGFDVVPTDCLAVHLARQLENPTRLTLAFAGSLGLSHGTMLTSLENAGKGAVRRNGTVVPVPAAWRTARFSFGGETRICVTIPWGDVATAFYSTGIPNIDVYLEAPARLRRMLIASRYAGAIVRTPMVQRWLSSRVPHGGPSAAARASGVTHVWGRVENDAGQSVEAELRTPEAYQLTISTALLIARRVLRGDAPLGFQTPAKAYGPDLVLQVEGTARSRAIKS